MPAREAASKNSLPRLDDVGMDSKKPLGLCCQFGKPAGRWRSVKFFLTVGQPKRLLSAGGRCNLSPVRSFHSMETNMTTDINLVARFAQALLAVSATGVSVLVLQFAMLA
jgi:hypothetical protein